MIDPGRHLPADSAITPEEAKRWCAADWRMLIMTGNDGKRWLIEVGKRTGPGCAKATVLARIADQPQESGTAVPTSLTRSRSNKTKQIL